MTATARTLLFILAVSLAGAGAGCSVRSVATSVPPRVFREVHGLRVRSYQIEPVVDDLRQYKAIEIHKLNNLMLDEIPAQSVEELNAGIVKEIKALKHFDHIAVAEGTNAVPDKQAKQSGDEISVTASQPTLVLEGYIDDYTPGIPKLRYIEQGNNHAILTVRIILRDNQTALVLGQVNITVENTRITSNVERMMSKSAEEVASYVRRSATHPGAKRGALANAGN